ncbi:MAG: amidohydrolase family protein [Gemmatimonadaceae bacterium]
MDSTRARLDVTHDLYPYTAFSTISDVLFPSWALAGGKTEFAKRVADATARRRMTVEMRTIFPQQAGRGLESIQFREGASAPAFEGCTLADYVRAHHYPLTVEGGIRAIVELQLSGGFLAIFQSMDEGDVERIMRHPWAMIESDGDLVGFGVGHPHPRSYGAFPRVLARYVRERHVLSLEEAIRRMTSLPAQQFGQLERGSIRIGAFADIAVFDATHVQDLATYAEPHRYPVGIVHVVVNGVPVLRGGAMTGAMPGRALRGPARPSSVRRIGGAFDS